ncbi:MAG: PAS domain S-box protein [Geobacteraceae bacterium]|nr:PAS domain S-box protein [Geobacteraceae bacterium]
MDNGELKESRNRYFDLFDLAPIGYLIIDGQGLILEANLSAANMLKMPRPGLIGQCLNRFFVFNEADSYFLQRKRLFESTAPQNWDMRIVDNTGSCFWAHLNAIPAENGTCWITFEDISRQKNAEIILEANLRLSEYAISHTLDELLAKILDEAEALTESTIGFFHFLEPDQVTLTLQTWSTNTLKTMCSAEGKGRHYPVDAAGVWVECVHTGAPVIHNDYASLPGRKGLPPGHAPVQRELVVPVSRNNLIVAIIGVGNKPDNYREQDLETVSSLIDFCWDIVASKRTSEDLARFFNLVPDLVCIASTDGYFRRVNPAWQAILGYSDGEILATPFLELVHPDDRATTLDAVERQTRGQSILNFVNRYRCKDGSYRWLEWVSAPSADNNLFAVARDITDRRLFEAQLEDSLRLLNKIASRVPGVVYQYRLFPDGRSCFPYASDAIRDIYRVSPLEVRDDAAQVFAVLHPDDYREIVNSIQASARNLTPWRHEYRVKFDDGTVRWLFGNAVPQREEDGSTLWHGFITDISGRKETEAALQKSQGLLKEAERIGNLGGWEVDIDTGQQTWTEQVYHIHEVDLSFVPTAERGVSFYTPECRPVIERAVRRAIEQGEPFDLDLEIITARGNRRYVHAIGYRDQENRRIFGFFQDISERKRVEIELQHKTAEMEQFTYSVTHDLRSPLVTFQTFLGYLCQDLAGDDDERVSKDIEFIRTAADRMQNLLEELLEYSRAGRMESSHDQAGFRELVAEAMEAVAGQSLRGRVNVQSADSDLKLCGDRRRLLQIWQNLLDNAHKYMGDQPSPRIDIGFERDGEDVRFFVRDNGVGIKPENREKVFDLFVRLETSGGGVGMGLAMVRRIVEKYGGRIWVESAGEGQGSCFRFTLPGALNTVDSKTDDMKRISHGS